MKSFWKNKPFDQLNKTEWDLLCDRCAKCCVQKLEDEDTGEIFYTNIACEYLDLEKCLCNCYEQREKQIKDCAVLSADNTELFKWLPETCAYRLVFEGKDLPNWHPLITNDNDSTVNSGMSAKGTLVEYHPEIDLFDHITEK